MSPGFKFVGLRFILEDASFLMAIMPEEEAKQLITDWSANFLKARIAGSNQYGSWSVKTGSIVGIHTVDLAQLQQAQQAAAIGVIPGRPWANSGI